MKESRSSVAYHDAQVATDTRKNVRLIMNYLKGEGEKTEPISVSCLAYINASKDKDSMWYNPEAYTEEEIVEYTNQIV